MRERGCFSTTILARPRRPCRRRHPYAVPRTSVQCVCTRRRNCIEQLSPSPEYAPRVARFPVSKSATIKLIHYPSAPSTSCAMPQVRSATPSAFAGVVRGLIVSRKPDGRSNRRQSLALRTVGKSVARRQGAFVPVILTLATRATVPQRRRPH